jgi:BirA family biotin operon repressor/biotin-[acetyl-CoA-carboxylase] ligase
VTPAQPWEFVVHAHESVGSTNDEAKSLARAGAPHGTVVWAKAQTAGRGRVGRTWSSPPGNLYCSVVLRPDLSVARIVELGFVAALGVAEVVEALVPHGSISLKWPNDVLVDGSKIAGILLECEAVDRTVPWVVVGIGVNVAASPSGLPYPATSLQASGANAVTATHVLPRVLAALRRWFTFWEESSFSAVRSAWLQRARRLDTLVRAGSGEEIVEGRVVDLDADGALILATPERLHRVTAGDVVVVEHAAVPLS